MLLAALLFAISPKFQDWAASPQAYFMTKAERAQWAVITTDDDAQRFIDKFIASRGPDFVDEVKTRAAIADKYLTYGKTPGSKSLRGKVIILLGPPASMAVHERVESGPRSGTTSASIDAAGSGITADDVRDASQRQAMAGKTFRDYTFTYPGLTVTVEADVNGVDRVSDHKQQEALEQRFEAAAAAPVVRTK